MEPICYTFPVSERVPKNTAEAVKAEFRMAYLKGFPGLPTMVFAHKDNISVLFMAQFYFDPSTGERKIKPSQESIEFVSVPYSLTSGDAKQQATQVDEFVKKHKKCSISKIVDGTVVYLYYAGKQWNIATAHRPLFNDCPIVRDAYGLGKHAFLKQRMLEVLIVYGVDIQSFNPDFAYSFILTDVKGMNILAKSTQLQFLACYDRMSHTFTFDKSCCPVLATSDIGNVIDFTNQTDASFDSAKFIAESIESEYGMSLFANGEQLVAKSTRSREFDEYIYNPLRNEYEFSFYKMLKNPYARAKLHELCFRYNLKDELTAEFARLGIPKPIKHGYHNPEQKDHHSPEYADTIIAAFNNMHVKQTKQVYRPKKK